MRVFHLAMGSDIAGQGAALRSASLRLRPSWTVDQMAKRERAYAWPQQHHWDPALAERLYEQADIVHLCSTLDGWRMVGRSQPKRLVVHHHGSEYRAKRKLFDDACQRIGAAQIVSTLDLLGTPGVTWVPVVLDPAVLPERQPNERITVAHSPTDREAKGTDTIMAALAGLPVDLDIIEGVTWAESLARKARAHIVIDQLDIGTGIGYGLAAVEAWGMGIPVVSGLDDPGKRERMVDAFGDLPFLRADASTLRGVVMTLAEDAALREEWGERGRAHVERWHSPAAVLARLEPVYEALA